MKAALLAIMLLSAGRALADGDITDQKQLKALHGAITDADYVCPIVKMAKRKGTEAKGARVKVWCGWDADRDAINSDWIYMVTVRPSGRTDVEESSMLGW